MTAPNATLYDVCTTHVIVEAAICTGHVCGLIGLRSIPLRRMRPAASKSVACLQDSCDAGWSSPPSAKVSQGFKDKLKLANQSSIRTASVGSDELNIGRKIEANEKKVSVRFGFEGSMLERLQGIREVNWSCCLRQLQVEEWFCEDYVGFIIHHHPYFVRGLGGVVIPLIIPNVP